ncbi:hypothetical protein H0H81_002075, partial [Sphagnurus paluster]
NVALQHVGAAAAMMQISETPIITRLLTCMFYAPEYPGMQGLRDALAVNVDLEEPGATLKDEDYPENWWCHPSSSGAKANTIDIARLDEYREIYAHKVKRPFSLRESGPSYAASELVKDFGQAFADANSYSTIFKHCAGMSARRATGLMSLYDMAMGMPTPEKVVVAGRNLQRKTASITTKHPKTIKQLSREAAHAQRNVMEQSDPTIDVGITPTEEDVRNLFNSDRDGKQFTGYLGFEKSDSASSSEDGSLRLPPQCARGEQFPDVTQSKPPSLAPAEQPHHFRRPPFLPPLTPFAPENPASPHNSLNVPVSPASSVGSSDPVHREIIPVGPDHPVDPVVPVVPVIPAHETSASDTTGPAAAADTGDQHIDLDQVDPGVRIVVTTNMSVPPVVSIVSVDPVNSSTPSSLDSDDAAPSPMHHMQESDLEPSEHPAAATLLQAESDLDLSPNVVTDGECDLDLSTNQSYLFGHTYRINSINVPTCFWLEVEI